MKEQAEATADYLDTVHWAINEKETEYANKISNRKLNKTEHYYNTNEITPYEFNHALKTMKKTKQQDQME